MAKPRRLPCVCTPPEGRFKGTGPAKGVGAGYSSLRVNMGSGVVEGPGVGVEALLESVIDMISDPGGPDAFGFYAGAAAPA